MFHKLTTSIFGSSQSRDGGGARTSRPRALHRLALAQTGVIMLIVVVALPFVFRSMATQLTEWQGSMLYDFPSGEQVMASQAQEFGTSNGYFNISAVDLDGVGGSVTLAVSGHRLCADVCPDVTVAIVSLNDDANHRRALPPSASFELTPDVDIFTETVELPIQGQPSLYPFDGYRVWLGLAGSVVEDGIEKPLTPALASQHAIVTTQNQLRDFVMAPPIPIDPSRVRSPTDPFDFFGVQELRFARPIHMEILAALLISLIAVSAFIAVVMRDIRDLVFGIGSLILAIWVCARS